MNCFQHLQTPAVGLCKHCARGLCPNCAHDEGFGLACKDRCEAEVKAVGQLIDRNKGAWQRTSSIYRRSAVFYGLMALLLLVFPFLFEAPRELRFLFLGMGTLFIFGAALNLFNARRLQKL